MISFGYDNEDKITSRTYPNGVTTSYSYSDSDLLKGITDAGPSGMLFDRQYFYNNARQISQIVEPNRTRRSATTTSIGRHRSLMQRTVTKATRSTCRQPPHKPSRIELRQPTRTGQSTYFGDDSYSNDYLFTRRKRKHDDESRRLKPVAIHLGLRESHGRGIDAQAGRAIQI